MTSLLKEDIQDHLLTSNPPCPLGGIYMKPQRGRDSADRRLEDRKGRMGDRSKNCTSLYPVS